MGSGLLVRCGSCEYERLFHLGTGFQYSPDPPEAFYECVAAEALEGHEGRETVRRLLTEAGGRVAAHGLSIYRCTACNGLHERLYLNIRHTGGAHVVSYRCPACGRRMRRTAVKRIGQCPCPSCGGLSLVSRNELLWD